MAGAGLPFLTTHWFYNTETGQLTRGNDLENLGNNLVGGAGWHELNIPGSDSAAQATAAAKQEFPSGKTPTTAGITPARVAQVAAGEAGSALGGFTIAGISGTNLAIRAAKVIIGGVLLIVGLVHITGVSGGVADVARKVPLPI
jgi:hypothetical protein